MLLAVGWRVGTRRPPRGPAMMLILPTPALVTRNCKTNHPEDGGDAPRVGPPGSQGLDSIGLSPKGFAGTVAEVTPQ